MFREMMRKNQALSHEECIALLQKAPRGILSVLGDDGYPYGVPMDHWYCEEDGKLYFHGAAKGHKIDAMRRCGKVSFCVYDEGYRREGEWSLNIKSVVVFGRVEFLTDQARAMEMMRRLSCKYTDDDAYIEHEILADGDHTLCFALVPEHISGKITNES